MLLQHFPSANDDLCWLRSNLIVHNELLYTILYVGKLFISSFQSHYPCDLELKETCQSQFPIWSKKNGKLRFFFFVEVAHLYYLSHLYTSVVKNFKFFFSQSKIDCVRLLFWNANLWHNLVVIISHLSTYMWLFASMLTSLNRNCSWLMTHSKVIWTRLT